MMTPSASAPRCGVCGAVLAQTKVEGKNTSAIRYCSNTCRQRASVVVDFCWPGMEQFGAPEHVASLENLVEQRLATVTERGATRASSPAPSATPKPLSLTLRTHLCLQYDCQSVT